MSIDTEFIKEWEKHYDKSEIGGDYLEYNNIIRDVSNEVKLGTITKNTFIKIIEWKAARLKGIIKLDNFDIYAEGIKKATQATENKKLSILDDLYGINVPVASTILHFIYPSIYPIMDIRVAEALFYLGYLKSKTRTQKNYENYRKVISNIAQESKCSIREIDRALFAYHKINVSSHEHICRLKDDMGELNKAPLYEVTEKPSFSFEDAFRILHLIGPARIISSRGTLYDVEAWKMRGGKSAIRAKLVPPKIGYIYIHSDCWGNNLTCQNVRAGGIYNGKESIYSWLKNNQTE